MDFTAIVEIVNKFFDAISKIVVRFKEFVSDFNLDA